MQIIEINPSIYSLYEVFLRKLVTSGIEILFLELIWNKSKSEKKKPAFGITGCVHCDATSVFTYIKIIRLSAHLYCVLTKKIKYVFNFSSLHEWIVYPAPSLNPDVCDKLGHPFDSPFVRE